MAFNVVIVSPERTIYDGPADLVLLPGVNGQVGVMSHHLPMFVHLGTGIVTVRLDGIDKHYTLTSGFAHVEDNQMQVLAEASESVEEIDVERAEDARKRALKQMSDLKSQDSPEFLSAVMKLHRSELRLKAVRRAWKHRKH